MDEKERRLDSGGECVGRHLLFAEDPRKEMAVLGQLPPLSRHSKADNK